MPKMPFSVQAHSFQGLLHFQSLGFQDFSFPGRRYVNMPAPAHGDPGKWLGNHKAVPRGQKPRSFRQRIEGSNGISRQLRQLHRARLHNVKRTAGAVGCEDRWISASHFPGQRQQSTGAVSRARTPHGSKSEMLNGARDQFPVEASADEYSRLKRAVKVACARDQAAVPETPYLEGWRRGRFRARLGDYFIPQRAMQAQQGKSGQSGNDGHYQPLSKAPTPSGVVHRWILPAPRFTPPVPRGYPPGGTKAGRGLLRRSGLEIPVRASVRFLR